MGEDKDRYAEASKAFNEAVRAKVEASRWTLEDLMHRPRPVEEHEDASAPESGHLATEVA